MAAHADDCLLLASPSLSDLRQFLFILWKHECSFGFGLQSGEYVWGRRITNTEESSWLTVTKPSLDVERPAAG